ILLDAELYRVPSSGAVGDGCGPVGSLGVSIFVRCADFSHVSARRQPAPQPEHPPSVLADFHRQLGRSPLTVVDAYLDLVDASGLRPCDARDRRVGAAPVEWPGTVDPRHRLDGGRPAPAAFAPE